MGHSESKETRSPLSHARIEQELARLEHSDVAVYVFDQVGSTNDDVVQFLPQLSTHRAIVVTADEQVAGRGRLDRNWSSPWGAGIALSIAVKASHIKGELTSVPLRAGLAVQQALADFEVTTQVKWPNDIVTTEGLKLGGLLSVARDNAVIVGIGVNVSLTSDELPTPTSTSLALLGHSISREELIARIVVNFSRIIDQPEWMSKYHAVSATLGQHVRLHRSGQPAVDGTVVWFGDDGSIQLETVNGKATFSIGDVEHLRPVGD